MSRRIIFVIPVLFFLSIAFVACQKETPLAPEGETSAGQVSKKEGPVLARVNDSVITAGDFEEEINSLPEYTRKQLKTPEQKKKRLNNMIKEIVLRQEAERRGLDQDKDIQRKVNRYKNRLITEKLYQQVAKENGGVTEIEVEGYYEEHKDQYKQKERIRASQILILVPPNADAEKDTAAKTKAQEVLKKAKEGEVSQK